MPALLYNKTCYSILQSSIRVEKLVEFARENNYSAIGICDTANFYAAPRFIQLCNNSQIKPVIGIEITVKHQTGDFLYLIYPKNNDGYRQLCQLTSRLSGDKAIDFSKIEALKDNCLTVIPFEGGYVQHLIYQNNLEELERYLSELDDSFYLAITDGRTNSRFNYNKTIVALAERHSIKLLPLRKAVYVDEEDFANYEILTALKNQTDITDKDLVLEKQCSLMTREELSESFDQKYLNETDRFVSEIELNLNMISTGLPVFPTPNNIESRDYLRQLCLAGLNKRCEGKVDKEYLNRLNYELDVICGMNFQDYFLIIYDIIRFARKQNIYIGPGRGSAVGSLTAYCLGISHIDPLKYGLLFERFLNPERMKMPDIDIDIPDESREDIIRYVKEKYGNDRVAHIVTFNSLSSRSVIRDVASAMKVDSNSVDIILKNIDKDSKISLVQNFKNSSQLQTIVNSSQQLTELFRRSVAIEGMPKNVSVHASGILISRDPLDTVIPVTNTEDGLVSQYAMDYLEQFGLIKFDFLSLRNLSTIVSIYQTINPESNNLDILKLPLDDQKTYDLLSKADSLGIFQLEKKSLKFVLSKIRPRNFEELVTVLAIGRPGSSQYIDQYVQNRKNPSAIVYLHPDLKPILESTYGIIVYQEQIMKISQRIAGFSLGKANILREAISKKNAEQLSSLKEDFIEGCLRHGLNTQKANEIYELIYKFANYGFNKSHAVAYGLISYQMAYLKANYPLQFYCELMNASAGDSNQLSNYVLECRGKGIGILPPDINRSTESFTVENSSIRFSLTSIKNISNANAASIISDRNSNGLFKDYVSCVVRLSVYDRSSRITESLIRSGALNCFGLSHNTMLKGLKICLQAGEIYKRVNNGQITFDFNTGDEEQVVLTRYADSPAEIYNDELEYLGMYLSKLPTNEYKEKYPEIVYSSQINNISGIVNLIVIINRVSTIRTRKGEQMCFMTGIDEMGSCEFAFMPGEYQKYKSLLKNGSIVYINGQKGERDSVRVIRMNLLKGENE